MDQARQFGRIAAVLLVIALAQVPAAPATAVPSATGVDVSNYQGDVDFAQVRASGSTFAFVLATDGTTFASPTFPDQYSDARAAGMFRGAYHFARPSASTGAAQADRFLDVIGWVRDPAERDGFTLPPVLDYEDVDGTCAGLSPQQHVDWIRSFIDRVHERTGRNPIIYTNRGTWQACTGDTAAFRDYRLWVAEWGVAAPTLFGGWPRYSFWQTTDSGSVPGITGPVDLNVYEGEITLQQLADAGVPPPRPRRAARSSRPPAGSPARSATAAPPPTPTTTASTSPPTRGPRSSASTTGPWRRSCRPPSAAPPATTSSSPTATAGSASTSTWRRSRAACRSARRSPRAAASGSSATPGPGPDRTCTSRCASSAAWSCPRR